VGDLHTAVNILAESWPTAEGSGVESRTSSRNWANCANLSHPWLAFGKCCVRISVRMYANETSGVCIFCGSSKQIMGLEKANCYCSGVTVTFMAFLSVATAQSRGCIVVGIAVSAFAGEVCADGSTVLLRSSSVSWHSHTSSSHFFSVLIGASYFLLVLFVPVSCWSCHTIYANAAIKFVSVFGLPTRFLMLF